MDKIESSFTVSAKASIETGQRIIVLLPALWSLETPTMYSLHSVILYKGKIIDEIFSPFGILILSTMSTKGFF